MYGKGKKSDAPDENLFASRNKMPRKVTFSWYDATKPFFVNENGITVKRIIVIV